jgi:hypothetical protein
VLTLSSTWTPDVLTESLAGVVDALQEGPGLMSGAVVLETARGATGHVLRRLRDHLQEERLLTWALSEVHPGCLPRILDIAHEHRLLKKMSHDLCQRIRRSNVEGAREVAHRFLAILIDHIAHEKRVLTEVVRSLNPEATRQFADALFEGMIRGARKESGAARADSSAADLNSLDVRLIQHLRMKGVPHAHD